MIFADLIRNTFSSIWIFEILNFWTPCRGGAWSSVRSRAGWKLLSCPSRWSFHLLLAPCVVQQCTRCKPAAPWSIHRQLEEEQLDWAETQKSLRAGLARKIVENGWSAKWWWLRPSGADWHDCSALPQIAPACALTDIWAAVSQLHFIIKWNEPWTWTINNKNVNKTTLPTFLKTEQTRRSKLCSFWKGIGGYGCKEVNEDD